MSKLMKLKEWIALSDAATYLSTILNEPISTTDIIQLAIDRHLRLSYFFPSPASAYKSQLVSFVPDKHGGIPKEVQVTPDAKTLEIFKDKIISIQGLVDIPLFVEEDLYPLLYSQISQEIEPELPCTFTIEQNDATFCPIQQYFSSSGPMVDTTNRPPADSFLVIRVSQLTQLQDTLGKSTQLGTRERNTMLKVIAALCKEAGVPHEVKGAAESIARITQQTAYPVSDDTISNILKQIRKYL